VTDLIRVLIVSSGEHKELLQAVYVFGYSTKEIAKYTKVKESNIKHRLELANNWVSKQLEQLKDI